MQIGVDRRVIGYLVTLTTVAVTFLVVGLLQAQVGGLPSAVLLYLVPIILAASRWGRGPAIAAAVVSILGHDLLFTAPRGSFSITEVYDAVGLALLLFTAVVTAQFADTARRSAETAREAALVRRADELKTALLHAVSHNLRTPLASIKASVSSLRQPGVRYTEEDRAELLAAIEEEADRLDRLVANLLDASRLEAGALILHKRPQDLAELAAAVTRWLGPRLEGRSVRVEMPEDLPSIPADYAQLEQVLTNLLENAALHTPTASPIVLRATRQRAAVRVEVVDQGPGVPLEERERLFRPFERGPTRATGSGLGLAIARGLVEAHGGRLWIEDGPGGGARFVFTLPLDEAA